MSSLLSRSRSLRKPAGGELGQKKETDTSPDTQGNARPASASPSRLPLKGTSTARHTRAGSTTLSKAGEDSTVPAPRNRPISGVFGLGRSASVRQPTSSSTANSSTTTTSRPPITTRNRPPAARPTSASGPSLSSSRPTTSSGLPFSTSTSAQPRGHTRTKSSATALTTSTILRPPSQTSSSTATTTSHETLRQPTSTSTASRPLSLHARQPSASASASSSSTATSTIPPRKRAPTTTSSTPDTTTSSIPHSPLLPTRRLPGGAKPAFTTLQQHFTPAKSLAPKPLTRTFLAPPSPSKLPTNVALSAETARLQTELLQLHLLHRDVRFVRHEWEASARERLRGKFDLVVEVDRLVGEEERRVAGGVNVAALGRWAAGQGVGDGKGLLEEKVGLLDGVLTTVWEVGERGGRYTRLVRRFERWVAGVREIVASRRGELDDGEEEERFITDLDASWKADCEGLARKLGECKDTTGVLSLGLETGEEGDEKNGGSSSSLERILDGVGQLVEDMLAEMELMVSIEREAVREENEWVRRVNGDHKEEDRGAAPRAGAGAIWRAF